MTATAHALIGSVIAASVSDPAIGLPLAFLSHPLADMIPHWDFGWGWRQKTKLKLFTQASVDLLIGMAVSFYFFGQSVDSLYLISAIFLSESWDILQTPYWLLGWKFPPFSWAYQVQHEIQGKARLPWGILTQAATIAALVLFLRPVISRIALLGTL